MTLSQTLFFAFLGVFSCVSVGARSVSDLRNYLGDQLADNGASPAFSRIVVPPGTYRLQPFDRQHLEIKGARNVEIVLRNVHLICTQTTRFLTIKESHNVTLVGPVTVDYDPLPFTQGQIIKLSDDFTVHDIDLDTQGYLTAGFAVNQKYEIFRPDTRTLRSGSYDDYTLRTFPDEPRRLQVIRGDPYRYEGEQVGDLIVIAAQYAPDGSIPHTLVIKDSVDVTLQDFTLYASNSFGFFETNCRATIYRRCRVDRQSGAVTPRLRSVNADAFHSKHAEIGPSYTDCTAQFMGDDAVAVNGDYHMVMNVNRGNILRVLAKVASFNIRKGDPLELLHYSGARLPGAMVMDVSTAPVDTISGEEREFLSQRRMHAPYKESMKDIYHVTIDRVLQNQDFPRGSLVGSSNRMGNGVSVTGCTFGYTRSRGIFLKASHSTIRNNVLQGVWMESIKIAAEYWWLEAGSGNNVMIDGNVIREGRGDAIAVYASMGAGAGIAVAGAHHDVAIQNNVIENDGDNLRDIWVTSTIGLVLSNNVYSPEKLVLEHCENVQLQPSPPTSPTQPSQPSPLTNPTPSPTSCFPGDAVVEGRFGPIALQNLEVGDVVLTGFGRYETVYGFGFVDPNMTKDYVQVHFQGDGSPLTVSETHLVMVADGRFIPAGNVIAGSHHLLLAEASRWTDVIQVDRVSRRGAFAPFTKSGVLVVDGVAVSNYATLQVGRDNFVFMSQPTAVSWHWIAHSATLPWRLWSDNSGKDFVGLSPWVLFCVGVFSSMKWWHPVWQTIGFLVLFSLLVVSWIVETVPETLVTVAMVVAYMTSLFVSNENGKSH